MADLAARIAALSPQQRALLSRRIKLEGGAPGAGQRAALNWAPIPRLPRPLSGPATFPLSFAQQRLWFMYQLDPQSSLFNVPGALRLRGPVNVPALERSLLELVRRHETLRTTIAPSPDGAVQVVSPPPDSFSLPLVDLGGLPAAAREGALRERVNSEARRPFDLVAGPLLRATLLRVTDDDHVLLVVVHHIISDGWSAGVMTREVLALYESFAAGRPAALPELPLQYGDVAAWQQEAQQVEALAGGQAYWESRLRGAPLVLEVPPDHPRPAAQTFRGARQSVLLPAPLAGALKALSQTEGATLYMTLLAAYAVLLNRYTGQTDLLVGTPVAGRERAETRDLIGCFINTLALRVDLSGRLTFRELLARVRETCLGAYAHQDVPFERLVEGLRPERDPSRSPIVQVAFGLQDGAETALRPGDDRYRLLDVHQGASEYDLTLELFDTGEGLRAVLEHSTDLYTPGTAGRLLAHYQAILEAVVADQEGRLDDLPLLPPAERRQLLVDWNATRSPYPRDDTYSNLFAAQASRTPEAIAAADESVAVTYRELEARAGALAARLVDAGVGPDVVVPLLGRRGVPLLTAILAVFRAGGAYLPLDPHAPALRLGQMIRESGSPVALVGDDLRPLLDSALAGAPDGSRPAALSLEGTPLDGAAPEGAARPTAGDLAYVIYTSGSTGRPKGVMVQQRGMINHLYAKVGDLGLGAHDVVAQTASQSFDISVWQFLAPLVVGGRVQVYPDEVAHDPWALLEAVGRDGVTVLEVVPSFLAALLDAAGGRGTRRCPCPACAG